MQIQLFESKHTGFRRMLDRIIFELSTLAKFPGIP